MRQKQFSLKKDFRKRLWIKLPIKPALSKGSLYNYFTFKDDLEIALAARSYEKLTALFSDAKILRYRAWNNSDVRVGLFINLIKTIQFIHKFPYGERFPTVITQSVVQESPNYADLITKIQQFITVWTGAVQRGLDDGSIHSTLDAMSLAIIVSMITSGMIDQIGRHESLLGQLQMDGKSILQIVFDWISKGLREE